MSHTITIDMVSPQEIELCGHTTNIHDIKTILVSGNGEIVGYVLKWAEGVSKNRSIFKNFKPETFDFAALVGRNIDIILATDDDSTLELIIARDTRTGELFVLDEVTQRGAT